jgi:hypothetical protein
MAITVETGSVEVGQLTHTSLRIRLLDVEPMSYREHAQAQRACGTELKLTTSCPASNRQLAEVSTPSWNWPTGGGPNLGLVYAAIPKLSRHSSGLSEPRETLIRFALYERMYGATTSMN